MGVITKLADLVRLGPPDVTELSGVPELYGDIAVVRDFGETVRILLCRAPAPGSEGMESVGLVIMPYGGFIRSLGWAATQFIREKH